MRARERVGDNESPERRRPAPQPVAAIPAAVLALQRAAGNRAVSRLVMDRQHQAPPQRDEPITVALYLPPEFDEIGRREFKRQAENWALNHNATGLDPDGHVRQGLPVPIDEGRPHHTLARVMRAVRLARGLEPDGRVPLSALAVFTHGGTRSLQTGRHEDGDDAWSNRQRLAPLLDTVADAIVAHGDVIFYACSAAGSAEAVDAAQYRNLVHQAYEDLAERSGRTDIEVWGHNTAGHTTGNADTASSSGAGREVLCRELARRSVAAGGGAPGQPDAIASLEARWREALTPDQQRLRAPLFALVEEVPMLGYDTFYRVVAGIESPATALSVFPAYTRGDRALFTEAVEIVRARFDAAVANVPAGHDDGSSPGTPARGAAGPAQDEQPGRLAALTRAQIDRALAFYRRESYPPTFLEALRARVGAPAQPGPADEALLAAVARFQAGQTPPLSADGMAGPRTLERLGLQPATSGPAAQPVRRQLRLAGRPRSGDPLGRHTFVPVGRRIGIVVDGREFLYASYGDFQGFQYAGRSLGGAFSAAIETVAARHESGGAAGDRFRAHAARSMSLAARHEGTPSAINTYDAKILTVGAGFAGPRLNAWLRSLPDPSAARTALAAVPYFPGLEFNRDEDVRLDVDALNQIAAAIEDPANAVAVAEAQVAEFVRASGLNPQRTRERDLRALDDFAAGALSAEPHGDVVLGVATYLRHGMPGYTPDPALDAQAAMLRHRRDPWAQVADICQRHVERMWRAGRDDDGLAARTVTSRIPNKLELVAAAIGPPATGTMQAVAPCMAYPQLVATGTGRPTDPESRVFLMRGDERYDFGLASSPRESRAAQNRP